MDDFDAAGGIAGKWLNVSAGSSLPGARTASPGVTTQSALSASPDLANVIEAAAGSTRGNAVAKLLDGLPQDRFELLVREVAAFS